MKYHNIIEGTFLSRPNRFIAHVEIEGKEEICHVKNTGRCKELLIPGKSKVYLEDYGENTKRKTRYSLISVEKETKEGTLLINMDSQAPNIVAGEWLASGGLGKELSYIKAECKYGESRLDFYFEYEEKGEKKQAFMEVKGVTLENDGIVSFPDAPTERGVKHIRELMRAVEEGYEAFLLFVVQMDSFCEFKPNDETMPEFGEALKEAEKKGVHVLVKACNVMQDSLKIKDQT